MDRASNYRIVADVMSLCEENDRLREKTRDLDAVEAEYQKSNGTAEISIVDAYFIESGKRAAVAKCVPNWGNKPYHDDETDTFEPYEKWLWRVLDLGNVPPVMSVNAFVDACDKQLRDKYDEKLKEAAKEYE